MNELRCDSKMHGILDGDTIEVRCTSRFCGAGNGVIVLHTFSISTGHLVETKRYQDPAIRKEKAHASRSGVSVRSA